MMQHPIAFVLFVIAVLYVSSSLYASEHEAVSIPLLSIGELTWSKSELDYIKKLNQKGRIKIATHIDSPVYWPLDDGSNMGFHYNVLKAFTDLVNIEIEVQLVTWGDYFYREGEDLERVKVDPNYTYSPELLDRVDLYLDGFTALPWREKMFDIIKYVPSQPMIVARKEAVPKQVVELRNKVFVTVKNSSLEYFLQQFKMSEKINYKIAYALEFDDMEKMVSGGQVDYTVYDSDRAFTALNNYSNLTIAWPIGELKMMGWAVHKDDAVLKSILDKYIRYAQETAVLDRFWKQSYGVTFVEYLRILKL